ncbi:hypothetical protein K438DRAFT_1993267 [Mycena galopus ATCC 62051]|nr:hypothetical protein K438DRAFT_1993267 [Mycena galopus ATCC 62051]
MASELSNFVSLSLEAKISVFELVLADYPSYHELLSSVCRQWRTLLNREPACNHSIDFTCLYWHGGVEEILALRRMGRHCRLAIERFRTLPLDLRVAVYRGPSAWDPQHFFVHALRQELGTLCAEVAHRVRTLEVKGCSRVLPHLAACSWPVLVELRLHVDDDPATCLMESPVSTFSAPAVDCISTSHMSPSVISFLPGDRVTFLELVTSRESSHLPVDASLAFFLQIVSSFPALEHLTITLDDIDTHPASALPSSCPSYCLQFLLTLTLSSSRPPYDSGWHSNWRDSTLWMHFTTPSLEELTVPQRWFTMGAFDNLSVFFARNGRIPRVITFVECPRALVHVWKQRHQALWQHSLVIVRPMGRS